MYKLNSNSQRTGLGIALKVMAGDKLDIFGKSYYLLNTSSTGTALTATDIINALIGSPTGAASGKGTSTQILSNTNGTAIPLNSFLSNNHTPAQPHPTNGAPIHLKLSLIIFCLMTSLNM